jgi:hypothetical protein
MDPCGLEATDEGVYTWTNDLIPGVTYGREFELHEIDRPPPPCGAWLGGVANVVSHPQLVVNGVINSVVATPNVHVQIVSRVVVAVCYGVGHVVLVMIKAVLTRPRFRSRVECGELWVVPKNQATIIGSGSPKVEPHE